jgi:uncharacterized membrane protein
MKQNFEYRNAAWGMLKADRKGAVLLLLIIMLINTVISTALGFVIASEELASFANLIAEIFVGIPLSYLFAKEILGFVRGGKIEISSSLVDKFKADYLKSIKVIGLMSIYVFLWSLLLLIPGIIKAYSYCFAPYISMDNDELTAEECINESMKLTNCYKMKLFLLDLSFIGWYLLCIVTLGIAILWVVPYHEAARIALYEDIKAQPQAIEE